MNDFKDIIMKNLKTILGIIGLFVLFVAVFFAAMWGMTLLWNAIIPEITFLIGKVTIWQMMGLMVICMVLFSDKSKIIEKL
jgi:hypothetical protein